VASSVYEDTAVWPETTFWYEIRAVMGDGHEEVVTGSPTKVTTGGRLNAALYAPSPNPTAGSTSIRFDVPTHVGPVKLMVYNVKGQLVRAIVNGESERGRHVSIWDGTNTQGQRVPSGVYFVRLSVGGETKTNKMMVLR